MRKNKIIKFVSAFLFLALISGCSTLPVKQSEIVSSDNESAYVIVNLAGTQDIVRARECDTYCSEWYGFGENSNGVHLFKKEIGETFIINYVQTRSRGGKIKGSPLKVEAPGVYFYGSILTVGNVVLFAKKPPTPAILEKVLVKYGTKIKELDTHGFSWE